MAGLGWQELIIVLVIVVIIFGAGKLPEIGGALGKGIKEFKNESEGEGKNLSEGTTAAKKVDEATSATSTVVEQREVRADEI
jgi:sec-independent protein translocase protein TatA